MFLPTLLEFIAKIAPELVKTLTLEQRRKFSVNELDVLGKELLSKWVEQLTPEQQFDIASNIEQLDLILGEQVMRIINGLLGGSKEAGAATSNELIRGLKGVPGYKM